MTPSIFFVSLVFIGISVIVSMILKSWFATYGKIPLSARLTGKEVAERMLQENGIYDVKVISVEGFLSDHYNPIYKNSTSVLKCIIIIVTMTYIVGSPGSNSNADSIYFDLFKW